jgi:hypothetical protein
MARRIPIEADENIAAHAASLTMRVVVSKTTKQLSS